LEWFVPTLRQLDYLVAIADAQHFGRAAKRTNTTQSTLSTQLKALEGRIGVELVTRSSPRVQLTPVGEEVVAIARRMLRQAEEIRSIGKRKAGRLSGVLRLGIPPTIGPSLLPRIIPRLRRDFPAVKLFVREDLPKALPVGLEDGTYDVIIAPAPLDRDGFCTAPLYDEALLLVHHVDHPLAAKNEVLWTDLRGLDVLILEAGHQCHDLVQALCEQSGGRVQLDYESTSLDMLREMVATGLGCTFMPGLYVEAKVRGDTNLAIRNIKGHRLARGVAMAWRSAEPRKLELENLVSLIRSELSASKIEGLTCLDV
jgi:LysR family transcriptional regulator, hydrogen peroxide-inducible genes activator